LKEGTREVSSEAKNMKPAGQWNRLQVLLEPHVLHVILNGKKCANAGLAGAPERGSFALQPESEMEFGNLFVRELKP